MRVYTVVGLAILGLLASEARLWGQVPTGSPLIFPFLTSPRHHPDMISYDFFQPGLVDIQFTGGYYTSQVGIGPPSPPYVFYPATFRLGVVTDCGFGDGPFQGYFEPMFEFSGAPVTGDIGHYYIGPSVLARYNFLNHCSRTVPYIQVGAGIIINDGYKNRDQNNIGSEIEFLLQAQIGLRKFVTDRISLDIEAGYIHISNGGLAPRNHGINALGASVGFSMFFGNPR